MTARLVVDALAMAVRRRGMPKELLHHSDRGSQYTSEDFPRLLLAHGCRRRFNFEPPCRSKFEPGLRAVGEAVGCG